MCAGLARRHRDRAGATIDIGGALPMLNENAPIVMGVTQAGLDQLDGEESRLIADSLVAALCQS